MKINKIEKIKGILNLPGDKSISHRAIMFASLAKGRSVIKGLLRAEDIFSTINCFENLGCKIVEKNDELIINGMGFKRFKTPQSPLDCGNSGTTTRLISGILSAQDFNSILFGDKSLSKRPMKRIIEPLMLMGARVKYSNDYKLPLEIIGGSQLKAIEYRMPVASAQVKSCILLAGLHIDEKTIIYESQPTRNHTEKMLALNTNFVDGNTKIEVSSKNYPVGKEYIIPSDISSAAFFIVLALCLKNSELIIKNVSLNNSRTGIIDLLVKMGGNIEIQRKENIAGEDFGDISIKSSNLKNVDIPKSLIPNIIDEIPILSVAGFFAEGNFKINYSEELRHKESDRINSLCENFRAVGCSVEEYPDGFEIINKKSNQNALIQSFDDHRIAMAFSIFGMISNCQIEIDSTESIKISNPEFYTQLKQIVS